MRLAFGEFTLDTDTRQLLRGEVELHLSPKAFDLLAALAEARPRALSRDALYRTLWGAAIVTEGNLTVLVAEVRRALGDSARAPRFVRTVQRYGYAFLGRGDGPSEGPADRRSSGSHWLLWGRRRIELPEGELVVGRDPRCQVHFDVPGVSRRHASLLVTAEKVTLEDLGSKNGTLREGEKVAGLQMLRDRDRLEFGPVSAVYRYWRHPQTTVSQASAPAPGRPKG